MHQRSEQATARAAKRGTKRTCQGEPCGLRYYDLNKDPIECPHCGSGYVPPLPVAPRSSTGGRARPHYKLEKPQPMVEESAAEGEIEVDDEVESVEDVEATADKVETILDVDDDADEDLLVPVREDGDNV
ncbi:MAG: TIGR02300 family protein [Hyphomicrobium sp.]